MNAITIISIYIDLDIILIFYVVTDEILKSTGPSLKFSGNDVLPINMSIPENFREEYM